MPKFSLDTNVLISHFNQLRPLDGKGENEAEQWARSLTSNRETNAILSPVEVEFLCGVVNRHEMRLYYQGFALVGCTHPTTVRPGFRNRL